MGPAVRHFLVNQILMIRRGRNLGQMGYADDLLIPGNGDHLLRHGLGHAAADPRIDFIKHHGVPAACPGFQNLHRQHNPAQFAARGDFRHRLQRFARVGRHQKLNPVVPRGGRHQRFSGFVFRKINPENGLLHPQPGKLLFHPRHEGFGQRTPGSAEGLRGAAIDGQQFFMLRRHPLQFRIQIVQGFQLPAQAFPRRPDLFLISVSLPENGKQVQPFFQFADPFRIRFHPAQLLRELKTDFFDLKGHRVAPPGKIRQRRNLLRGGAQQPGHLLNLFHAALACLVRRQEAAGFGKTGHAFFRFPQAAVFFPQAFFGAGSRIRPVNFLQLPLNFADPLLLFLSGPNHPGISPMIPDKGLIGGPDLLQQRLMPVSSHPVQKRELLLRIIQKHMVILAVQIHQQRCDLPENSQGYQHPVQAAGVSAPFGDFPKGHELAVLRINLLLRETFQGAMPFRQMKYSLHRGFFASGTDHALIRPGSENQIHRIHHKAFARAGFTAQRVHASVKVHGHALNQRKLLDSQGLKHGFPSFAFLCRSVFRCIVRKLSDPPPRGSAVQRPAGLPPRPSPQ